MSETDGVPVLVRPLRWGEPSMGEGNFVLPTGTVTLVLGDVEGSTRAWEADPKAMEADLAALNAVVDEEVGRHDGVRPVEQGEGDSFVAAFARARDAVACALAIQRDLADGHLKLRIGVHAGDVVRRDEGNYAGPVINRAARIRDTAHGGQLVLSETAAGLAVDALPDGASLADLGVHRLPDLSRPERIFQLCHDDLPVEFPRLRSLDARSHNLPVQRTTFIGRHDEMAAVKRLVTDEPLVTLVGSGGCGKTRLAVHVAAEVLNEYSDGVWLADLAAVADPDAVPMQVGQIFALKEGPGMTATDALVAFLGGKRALLILDNCEHVLAAAAALADRLVSSCPTLHLLATSRQPLDLPGEIGWRVPSLTVPDDDDRCDAGPADIAGLAACEAVQLFVDRGGRARPGFALTEANAPAVAEVCRRLDGIPLAIELAAARVRVFTPAQIAAALDRRFELLTGVARTALPRQQTLEASVGWSHDLLTDLEQAVFRRLSVFAGSFDYGAAVAVCAAPPIAAHQVLDELSLLVDKSLVLVDDSGEQARYRLLETVRDYAAGRLAQADEETATGTAHRDHYRAFAEEAEAHLEGRGQTEWLTRVADDYSNLRAALAWSQRHGDSEQLARIAAAIHMYWNIRGPNAEGVAWLDDALAQPEIGASLRARLLFGRSYLAMYSVEMAIMRSRAEEGLLLAREIGDDRLTARLLACIGASAVLVGRPDPTLEEGLALGRQAGDPWVISFALVAIALGRNMAGDLLGAVPLLEEGTKVAEEAGNHALASIQRGNMAQPLWWLGDLLECRNRLEGWVVQAEEGGHRWALAMTLGYLANVLTELDERAETLIVASRMAQVATEAGLAMWDAYGPLFRGQIAVCEGDAQAAISLLRESVGGSRFPVTAVVALTGLVEAELAAGLLDDAEADIVELADVAERGRLGVYAAWAIVFRSRLARRRGELRLAEDLGHEGLDRLVAMSAKSRIIDALEALAGVATDTGTSREAARILGSASRLRDRTGYARCVSERDRDVATLQVELGADSFQTAYDEGRSLDFDDAVAYARRGRGDRRRPDTGWASLTPAEIRVAELVRGGLSNADIGTRLLCSPRTVQAHLTHIYTKLGMNSRTELAAEATRQGSHPTDGQFDSHRQRHRRQRFDGVTQQGHVAEATSLLDKLAEHFEQ